MTAPERLPPLLANGGEGNHEFTVATQSAETCPSFTGIYVLLDFVSETESSALMKTIEKASFLKSQSGKQKQHYGPKVNFNKRRVNPEAFTGLPTYAPKLEARLRERVSAYLLAEDASRGDLAKALSCYETTDVFVLRYRSREQSNLDFHLDDVFAYGELILDLSLESDSVISFYRGRPEGEIKYTADHPIDPACVRVPIPARSMLVLFGAARFEWEHAIRAPDIATQRTSITLRTLSSTVLETEAGQAVLERARQSAAGGRIEGQV